MTTDSATRTLDSIDLPTISFSARIATGFETYTAMQNDLTPKKIATSLEGLAKDLLRHAKMENLSYLGSPVQLLDFADEVAEKRNSRFILAYHPCNLPDPDINNRLSDPNSTWRHLNRQACFFQVFRDWSCLVAHMISICRMPEYQNYEPICILFPANCSSILNSIFCDIPAVRELYPNSVSFHGQLGMDGMPLTWLPAELAIAGTPLYASTNVFGLGFISTEKTSPRFLHICSWALVAGYMLYLTLTKPHPREAFLTCILISLVLLLMGFILDKEIVVRRKRRCDGVGLIVDRCKIKLESINRPFALDCDVPKKHVSNL